MKTEMKNKKTAKLNKKRKLSVNIQSHIIEYISTNYESENNKKNLGNAFGNNTGTHKGKEGR